MVNLRLRCKPTELKEYSFIVKTGISCLEAGDYLHYYNLRSLLKKFLDKQFSCIPGKKELTMRININEWESLKYISPVISEDPYYNALYIGAALQMDKQVNNMRFLT